MYPSWALLLPPTLHFMAKARPEDLGPQVPLEKDMHSGHIQSFQERPFSGWFGKDHLIPGQGSGSSRDCWSLSCLPVTPVKNPPLGPRKPHLVAHPIHTPTLP